MKLLVLLFFISSAAYCEETICGVPIELFNQLILSESNHNPNAINTNINGTQDLGYMQLNTKYLDWFAMKFNNNKPFDPFNKRDSIRIGCAYLRHLYEYTGSWFDAFWAYNAGPTAWKKNIMPVSTRKKLSRIFTYILRGDFMSATKKHEAIAATIGGEDSRGSLLN